MIFIQHRVNTTEQLAKVPRQNGAEVDVRYHQNELVLHHEPFKHHQNNPEKFESWLKEWKHHGPLILNVKTEGIEQLCIRLMHKYQVKHWFFLDLSMPYFVIYAEHAKNQTIPGFSTENLAVRFSEYEPIEYALAFSGKARWVWVDCFKHLPMNADIYHQFNQAGFKTCIVSPELQKHSMQRIAEFKKQLNPLNIHALCTKRPDLWGQALPTQAMAQLTADYPFQ